MVPSQQRPLAQATPMAGNLTGPPAPVVMLSLLMEAEGNFILLMHVICLVHQVVFGCGA